MNSVNASIEKWNNYLNDDDVPSDKATAEVYSEALAILSNPTDKEISQRIAKTLDRYKFRPIQRGQLFQGFSHNQFGSLQIKKMVEANSRFEDLFLSYTIFLDNTSVVVSEAEFRTIGLHFDALLSTKMAEREIRCVSISDIEEEHFSILLHFLRRDVDLDMNEPEMWLVLRTMADRFQLKELQRVLPPFPRFKTAKEAVKFTAGLELPELDLTPFGDNIGEETLGKIQEMKELKRLSVGDSYWVTDDFVKTLPRGLESLKLLGCFRLTDQCVEYLPDNLLWLQLDCFSSLHDASADKFPANLIYLKLYRACDLTDGCIEKLSTRLAKLKTLDLGATRLTGVTFHKLSPDLEHLYLNNCLWLENDSIALMPRKLLSLFMDGCHLRQGCLAGLPPGLKRLSLGGMYVRHASLISTIPRTLEYLSVADWQRLCDSDVPHFPPLLRYLDISGCRRLTDASAGNLPPNLEVLKMKGCSGFTKACIPLLPKNLVDLEPPEWFDMKDYVVRELGSIKNLVRKKT